MKDHIKPWESGKDALMLKHTYVQYNLCLNVDSSRSRLHKNTIDKIAVSITKELFIAISSLFEIPLFSHIQLIQCAAGKRHTF